MKTTPSQAVKRLFKKLSALRATLPNEERAILDILVVFDEVPALKMTGKGTDKVARKAIGKAIGKSTFRISYDPNSEEYKIQE